MSSGESVSDRELGEHVLRVVVRGPNDRVHERPVDVVVVDAATGRAIPVRRRDGEAYHVARLGPGRYVLEAATAELVAPPRELDVLAPETVVPVYLGEPGWPFYRLGGCPIPFAPPDGLLAVAFPLSVPGEEEALRIGEELMDALGLEPIQVGDRPPRPSGLPDFRNADDAVWLFRLQSGADQQAAIDAALELVGSRTDAEARVGVPVDLNPGHVTVLDTRVTVRFAEGVDRAAEERLLVDAGARPLRAYPWRDRTSFLATLPGHPLDALAVMERWHDEGLVEYAEPDALVEIVDAAFPATAPNDPLFTHQHNLALQRVDAAWKALAVAGLPALGRPSVVVATLDRGAQIAHPDIGGALSDGAPQLSATCWDFSVMTPMSAPGYRPPGTHGTGVLGIIAARTDNGKSVAGIAPNTRQLCVGRPRLGSDAYTAVIRWLGGPGPGRQLAGWPAPPRPWAAVVVCAHTLSKPSPSALRNAYTELSDQGTVVVYSAGNLPEPVTGNGGPDHTANLAVANSLAAVDGDPLHEYREPRSNYGPEIAVCAQGEASCSLDSLGGEQTFGGTSAAAAVVGGVIALMLSRNPQLRPSDVRVALTGGAEKIDSGCADPTGGWANGFSQWYGHGRIDAARSV